MIYLDNAGSTKPRREVIETLIKSTEKYYGNADGINNFSFSAAQEIKKVKKIISGSLNVNPNEIFFTAGGGDGNNIVLQGIIEANGKHKNHLITTTIEHPTVYEVFKYYEQKGYKVDYLDVNENGIINYEQLKDLVNENTLIVSIGAVNSETGHYQNIEKLVKIVKEKNKNTYFHTDFVQGYGTIDLNISKIGLDAVTVSGHKIHAFKGIGAVYINKNVNITNIVKGANEENGIVKRTLPTELILSFGKAVKIMIEKRKHEKEHIYKLKKYLYELIEKNIIDVVFNTPKEDFISSPKILNVSFLKTKGEVLTHFLGMSEIYVSTGSACSSKKGNSRILTNMGISSNVVDGAIRFSFSYNNTLKEMEKVVEVLKKNVERIRKMR